jgi:myo-inositol 2-dehydrogenase / D-chiro-inositol 1-dehydrogenase
MAKLRYAIIGSGMMGHEHIRNIKLLKDTAIVAVSDPDPAMRESAAALAGSGTRSFTDHRALIDAGLADALLIASPNHTHEAILMDALATDLPILVEKPLCETPEASRRILAAARGRKAPVWVAMEYRYMPPVQRLIGELRAGTAGRLHMLTIREHRFPFLQKVGDWNRFSRQTGGTMVEKCCHFFDLMRLVTGAEPVRLYASGGHDVNHLDEDYSGERPDILDNGYVVVDFDNGVRAMLELCMFAEGSWFQEAITAVGDLAKIEAFVPGPSRFWPSEGEREAEIVISPREPKGPQRRIVEVDPEILAAGDHHGSTFYQHRLFSDMVLNGGTPEVTLEDGLRSVEMGAAAELSARTGQAVEFPEGWRDRQVA